MSFRLAPPLVLSLLLAGCGSLPDGSQPDANVAPSFVPSEDASQSDEDDVMHWDEGEAEAALDATWYGDVLVSNDALVLDGVAGFEGFTRDQDAVTLRFAGDAAAAGIREGQVLVSGLGAGLLVRVESIRTDGAIAHVDSSTASLTDVIYHGLVAERLPLNLEAGDLPPSPLRDPSSYDFSGTPLFSVSGGGGSAAATIETGVVTLDPTLDFGVNIDWFDWNRPWPKLEKADLGVGLGSTLELVVHAEAEGAFSRDGERDLFAFNKPFAFQVGPVPVAGEVEFDVELVWEVSATGAADARVGTNIDAQVSLGGRYEDGDWLNTSGFEWSDSIIGPELTLDGTATVRASVRVTAKVSLYSAVSAEGSAEPWVQADAALQCGNIDWNVDVGVDLTSSVGYDILGFSGDWDFPPFAWDKRLAEGSLPIYDVAIDPACGDEGPEDPTTTLDEGDESGGADRPDDLSDLADSLITEQCVDGVDNDTDGQVDCADTECADSMTCGSECQVWDNISCGSVVTASTLGLVEARDSKIGGYPINPGVYSGPEAAFAFRSPVSGTVTFRLVDPTPTEVDQDIVVLHSPTGVCSSDHAVAWGPNSMEFDATRGEQYIVVVDGFDGDAGEFTLEVVCGS
jgi:hypothetical protein